MSNFFQELAKLISNGSTVTLNIVRKDESITVGVVPSIKSDDKIPMLTLTGTPAEMDEEFIQKISEPIKRAEGLITNAEQFEEDVKEVAEEMKDEKPSTKKPAAKKPAKKAPAKKVAKKAASKSKPEPQQEEEEEEVETPAADSGPAKEQGDLFS